MPPKMPKGVKGPPQKAKKGTLKRLLKTLFTQNAGLMIAIIICLTLAAVTNV